MSDATYPSGESLACAACGEAVPGPGGGTWVACEGCQRRHHPRCWDDSGRCSACRYDRRVERSGGGAVGGVGAWLVAVLLALVLLGALPVGAYLFFGVGVREGGTASPQAEFTPAEVPATPEPAPAEEVPAEPAPEEAPAPAAPDPAQAEAARLARLEEAELAGASPEERRRLEAAAALIDQPEPHEPPADEPRWEWLPDRSDAGGVSLARKMLMDLRIRASESEDELLVLLLRAHAEERTGDVGSARVLAERALDLKPDCGPAWTVRGWARLDDSDRDGAELDLRRGVALSADPTWAWIGLGRLAQQRGDAAGARAAYRQALEANGPTLVGPADHAGDLRRRLEQLEPRSGVSTGAAAS